MSLLPVNLNLSMNRVSIHETVLWHRNLVGSICVPEAVPTVETFGFPYDERQVST